MNEAQKELLRHILAMWGDEGRYFVANHLWKHYSVGATKLVSQLEDETAEDARLLAVGTAVRYLSDDYTSIPQGSVTTIMAVDEKDPNCPYQLLSNDGGLLWAKANEVKEVHVSW